MISRLTVGCLFACLVALASAQQTETIPTITVSGNGEVRAAPDLAIVQLGVTSERRANAAQAQNEVNEAMNRFIQRLVSMGIDRKEIQTSQVSLQPFDWREREQDPPQRMYIARNSVSIRLKDFSKIGPVIDAAVAAGVNTVQGVSFALENDRAAKQEALKKAVEDARSKAEALANALGVRLGIVLQVNEAGAFVSPPPMFGRAAGLEADMSATPVEPGQVSVSANVTISFRIA